MSQVWEIPVDRSTWMEPRALSIAPWLLWASVSPTCHAREVDQIIWKVLSSLIQRSWRGCEEVLAALRMAWLYEA
jgi:hypothetical protein